MGDPARLRILHVGPEAVGRGGMAAVLRDIGSSPLAERFDVAFITTWEGDAAGRDRIAIFARGLARLAVWCLRPGRRVVHIHTAVRGSWYRKAPSVLVARALGRPVVLQVHSGANDIAAFCERMGPVRRRLVGWAFKRASRVLSVSAAGAQTLRDRLGLDVAVVPNAAPRVALPDPGERGGAARVLYLGGFANAAKGGRVLVEALPRLLDGGPPLEVTLAGPGEPPAELGSDGRARWVGWLDEEAKLAELARADIVVLPSISEGLPIALLEAMVAGRAVVAARTGGMPEIVTDGVDGVLTTPGDAAELADAIRALAADRGRMEALGREARERAARLNHDEVYGRLERVYRELAGGREPDRPLRAVLVCSPGGHLQQMLALRPAWGDLEVTWATLPGRDVEHLLADEDVVLGHGPTNRALSKVPPNLAVAWRVLKQRDPDVILSTGAGLAVPFFLVGKLRGVRLVYVESLTRTEGLSLSGRLVAPLADELFVQWPEAREGRARFVGSIL